MAAKKSETNTKKEKVKITKRTPDTRTLGGKGPRGQK